MNGDLSTVGLSLLPLKDSRTLFYILRVDLQPKGKLLLLLTKVLSQKFFWCRRKHCQQDKHIPGINQFAKIHTWYYFYGQNQIRSFQFCCCCCYWLFVFLLLNWFLNFSFWYLLLSIYKILISQFLTLVFVFINIQNTDFSISSFGICFYQYTKCHPVLVGLAPLSLSTEALSTHSQWLVQMVTIWHNPLWM